MEYTGQQSFNGSEMVNYTTDGTGNGTGGNGYAVGDYFIAPYSYYPWYREEIHHYYPTYTLPEKSKIEQAFKIVSKLMEKKIVSGLNVKQFVGLVNDIAEIL